MEWDTAAGHAVLIAAGGRVDRFCGGPLEYGKAELDNPSFYRLRTHRAAACALNPM